MRDCRYHLVSFSCSLLEPFFQRDMSCKIQLVVEYGEESDRCCLQVHRTFTWQANESYSFTCKPLGLQTSGADLDGPSEVPSSRWGKM
jgi:hypothetical protein